MTTASPSRIVVLARALLIRWRLVLFVPIGAAVLAAVASLLVPSRYRAVTTFTPVGRRMPQLPSALAGVASQFLPSLGATDAAQSPGYYVQVLQSRGLMTEVLERRYPVGAAGDSTTLLDVLAPPPARDEERRRDKALRRLREAVAISADNQTAILTLGVELRDRALAAAVANAFVERLNAFNLATSAEQARQRRVFVEERRNEVAGELREAEERLRAFLRSNRVIQNAPDLEFEYTRLQRQVSIRQEMFLTLSRSYEQMRVEETNDVAAITVIDQAVPPVRRSFPGRRVWVMVAFFLALTAVVTLAAVLDWIETARRHDAQGWGELRELWGRALDEARRRPSQAGAAL